MSNSNRFRIRDVFGFLALILFLGGLTHSFLDNAAIKILLIILLAVTIALHASIRRSIRLVQHFKELFLAVEQSPSSVMITDIDGKIEYVNPCFTRFTGYTLDEVKGKNPRIFKSGNQKPEVYKVFWDTILAGKEWRGEFCNRKKNGEEYWEYACVSSIRNQKGKLTHFVAVKEDITERKKMDAKLNYYATTDEMTGTFNRRTGLSLLENLMKLAEIHHTDLIVCFADINNLKYVNDTFGHEKGDLLITTTVKTMKEKIRDTDVLCRVGGDEFLIFLPDCSIEAAEKIWMEIKNVWDKINASQIHPFEISVSHGLAVYGSEYKKTMDELINEADEEMYKEKKKYKEMQK